jgi:hypothetical protein
MPYSREHKRDTREKIIESARRLFNKKGFASLAKATTLSILLLLESKVRTGSELAPIFGPRGCVFRTSILVQPIAQKGRRLGAALATR